jgi:hypothetical protein
MMTLAVIGAGFGRTGTASLKSALERLGLAPCYHMFEIVAQPEHSRFWLRAAIGRSVDWDELLGPYRAAVDWPACRFYVELAAHYPSAKVVLTVREPAQWFESAWSTIFPRITRPVDQADEFAWLRARMQREIIIEQTFGGDITDRAHALAVFERHNAAVCRTIPAERLLVYEIAAGWQPLCDFLGRPVPDEPVPHANAAQEFRARFQGAR